MELMNEAATNIGESAPFSDITINQWREAEKDPNGISASGYPNYVAYPNTDWAQILFQPAFYQKYGVNVSGGSKTQLTCCHSVIRIIRELWTIPVWNV